MALGRNLLVAFMSRATTTRTRSSSASVSCRTTSLLDPHRGARGRRPRHQAGSGGDHPGHPERLRGRPGRPRRARHHPRRRRGPRRRPARRQGHAQGRDRADAGGAPAPRDLRREGARGPRHLLKVPHGETGTVIGVKEFAPTRATTCPRASTSSSASTSPTSARSPTVTSSPAATATRASSPRSCRSRTCRSSRTARRSTSCSTRTVCRVG